MAENFKCSICKQGILELYKNRPHEKCNYCGAKARHRIGHQIYQDQFDHWRNKGARCLHLAPEKPFYELLKSIFGGGYLPADPRPAKYPHTPVLKLTFPNDYAIFPDNYFEAIIHNHVLEHIPGHYKDHLKFFLSKLKVGGIMVFSVPGPYFDRLTEEGGEFETDEEVRKEKFTQEDHLKIFGNDFVEYIKSIDNAKFMEDGITDEIREKLHVRPEKVYFYLLQKKS